MDDLYQSLINIDQPIRQTVDQIQALCCTHTEDAIMKIKTMKDLTSNSPDKDILIREIRTQIIWNFAVKAFFVESAYYNDTYFCDWSLTLLQRLALICPNKNSWKFFLNDELVPQFHDKLGLLLFKLITMLGLEPPALLSEYNNANTTGASSADLNMSNLNDSFQNDVIEKTPEKPKTPQKPTLTRSMSSRALFSDPNINRLCNIDSNNPPVLNAIKQFQKGDKNVNVLFMPMTNRTKLTHSAKRKQKSPKPKNSIANLRKSPAVPKSSDSKRTPQSTQKKIDDKISSTPKSRGRTRKSSVSSKDKTPASSTKLKKILETPNPDKYKPRWERAIDAALKKTDKEYKIAESPMKNLPTSPLTSPIRRLRSIPSRTFTWDPKNTDSNSNLITPILNFSEVSRSSISQSATMNKAEMWRRNQMLEELSLSQYDSNFDSFSNKSTCDTLNLNSANTILTKRSQRRKSNLFDKLMPENSIEKTNTKIDENVMNKGLLTPSKLRIISSPIKNMIPNSIKFDPFKSPIKSSLKSPIKSPGSQKRVSIANFQSRLLFSPHQKTEKSSFDSSVITPLNFDEKILASSPLITRLEEKQVHIESPKLFGTSKTEDSESNKENSRPIPKKRGRPNSKINKALLKTAFNPRNSYKNPDLGMPINSITPAITFASFDEDAMFLDKEQFVKKQTESVYNESYFMQSDLRTPMQTPLKPEETPVNRKRIRPESDTNDSLQGLESSNLDSSLMPKAKYKRVDPRQSPKLAGMNFISRSTRRSRVSLSDETPKIYSITPKIFEKNDESNTQSSTSRNRNLRHSQIFGDTFDSLDTINHFIDDSSLLHSDSLKGHLPFVPIFKTSNFNSQGNKSFKIESPVKKKKRSSNGARRALFKQI